MNRLYIQIPFLTKILEVECFDDNIRCLLKKFYRYYLLEKVEVQKDIVKLYIKEIGDKYYIKMNEKEVIAGCIEYCVNCVGEMVAHNDYFDYNNFWFLHGSFMVRKGRAVMLVGGTGNGKSTLTMGLYKSNYLYGTDDLIYIDKVTKKFCGFLRPVQIRDFELIKQYNWYDCEKCEMIFENGSKDPYSRTVVFPSMISMVPIEQGDIYLLDRKDTSTTLTVKDDISIEELLYNTYYVNNLSENIRLVTFLMSKIKVKKIVFSDGEQVVRYLMKEGQKND